MPIRTFASFRSGPVLVDSTQPASDPRNLWRTGLLLATSAALGGIAVAIWDRRTLAKMRQQTPPTEDEP
ncbi:MAG: hypothetical protein ABSC65_28160 [Acidobacteriaceae bacterium]